MSAPVLDYASPSASARSVLMGLLLLLFSAAATAYTPLEIGPDFETLDLQPYVQLAIDEHDDLSPEQVLDQADLRLNTSARNNLGFMAKTLWIRFQLASATDGPDLVLLKIGYPMLDQVTLYLSHADGSQQRFEAGDMLPFGERAVKNREPTFEIPLDRGTPTTGILRLQTQGSLQFPLTLWDAQAYATHIADQQFYYGLYYGVFVVLALLACISFRFTRDATFLLLMADAVADWQAAADLGDRLLKRIASLRFDGDSSFSITASLGIALALPKPGIVAEELVQRADKALYSAKRDGRNRAGYVPPSRCPRRSAQILERRSLRPTRFAATRFFSQSRKERKERGGSVSTRSFLTRRREGKKVIRT